jgi:hypothetical protein
VIRARIWVRNSLHRNGSRRAVCSRKTRKDGAISEFAFIRNDRDFVCVVFVICINEERAKELERGNEERRLKKEEGRRQKRIHTGKFSAS